jgi:NADPH:quinone reductase-like Zn-dependent oxidoreductase
MSYKEGAAMPEAWLTAFQLLNKVLKVEENSGKTALIYAAASGVGSSLI